MATSHRLFYVDTSCPDFGRVIPKVIEKLGSFLSYMQGRHFENMEARGNISIPPGFVVIRLSILSNNSAQFNSKSIHNKPRKRRILYFKGELFYWITLTRRNWRIISGWDNTILPSYSSLKRISLGNNAWETSSSISSSRKSLSSTRSSSLKSISNTWTEYRIQSDRPRTLIY